MSGSYEVTMDDLRDMAQTFQRQAHTLTSLSGKCPAVPDGGDGAIDQALSDAVQTAKTLINQLAGAVQSHGEKLAAAEQQYRSAEQSNSELVSKLTALGNGNS
jgi:hypothetical protein